MKRHLVEASDLDILTDQQFTKRLKLEDYSFLSCSNFKHLIADDCRIVGDNEPEELKDLMHVSGIHDSYQTFDSLNSTLGKLHHQREGRKLLRRSCMTSPISSLKSERESMIKLGSTPEIDVTSVSELSMSQGNERSELWSMNCRKQQQFQRDYEARAILEIEMRGKIGDRGETEHYNSKRMAPDDMHFEPSVKLHHHHHYQEERYKQESFRSQQQSQNCSFWKMTPESESLTFHEDDRKMDVD